MVPGDPLYEGFEGTTFPPEGWTSKKVRGTVAWERYDLASEFPIGTASASVNWGSGSGNENWLITPQLEPVAGQNLSFQIKTPRVYTNTTLHVKVSTASNAIEDFTTTKLTLTTSYPANITTSWVTHTVNLSEYVGQKIYIAFYIIDYNGSRLMIDEINGPNTPPILCGKPESISVQIDSSNPAATVTWSDTTASNWILEYSE